MWHFYLLRLCSRLPDYSSVKPFKTYEERVEESSGIFFFLHSEQVVTIEGWKRQRWE